MQKIFLRSITVVQSKSFLNMSSITKISIDKAVYEYSGLIWGDLVGESPEKCVGILSAGKGITPKNISDVKSKIQELKKRTPFFVPRVRMEKDYGYGSANAKWLRSLKTRENSLKMSVVYLADAVNDIIRKPNTDQIARLRETVDEESRLKKDGQQLTAEQTAKLEGVEKQVSEIREQMKKLPKCTNAILTTLLHEVVDDMSEEDGSALEEITREISEQSALIEQYTKAKAEEEAKEKDEVPEGQEKPVVNEELILRHEHKIAEIKKAIADLEKDRFEIYTAYYEKFRREMTPQAIADQLIKFPGTFWEAWDINTEMISVSVTIESKKKDDTSKSTHEERGLSLMAFPYSINMTSNSKEFLSDLDNDLKVTDDWNRWMKAHRDEKTFSETYRQAYESHRQRLKTLPMEKEDKAESTQQPASPPTLENIQTKIMKREKLTEADQLYLIRVKHECPKCGRKLTEHTSQIGRKYVSCDCQYYAPGTFENPAIDEKYKTGVIRQRP